MPLTLFILEPNEAEWDNENSAWITSPGETNVTRQVVRAKTRVAARILASAACGDEGPDVWLDPTRSRCRMLTIHGAEESVCIEVTHHCDDPHPDLTW